MNENWNEVIEKLYLEMFEALFAYARNAMRDYSLAEEAVQETFRIACFKKDSLLKSKNRPGWLMESLKNVINNTQKRHARLNNMMLMLMSSYSVEVGTVVEEVDIDTVYGDLIGVEDFRLLKRVSLENYSMLEAATELGISVEACKKRVQRAKKKLIEALRDGEKDGR